MIEGGAATLVIRDVSRIFAGARGTRTMALAPTDLRVVRNDFITILGPSGCGKSTLLRLVAGLDRPTTGAILLDGKPIVGPGPDRGMVFQSYTLFPWLTVAQNIAFGLRERSVPVSAIAEIVTTYIGRMGLSGFENHLPRQLSGGMQQRTAIARALANDPAILLMDEPFGALDAMTRQGLQDEMLSIVADTGATVFFVTHDLEEAVYLGDRVIGLLPRPGRVGLTVTVDLPRPRDQLATREHPEFLRLRRLLFDFIHRAEA